MSLFLLSEVVRKEITPQKIDTNKKCGFVEAVETLLE